MFFFGIMFFFVILKVTFTYNMIISLYVHHNIYEVWRRSLTYSKVQGKFFWFREDNFSM